MVYKFGDIVHVGADVPGLESGAAMVTRAEDGHYRVAFQESGNFTWVPEIRVWGLEVDEPNPSPPPI